MSGEKQIIIVDENDNEIGVVPRSEHNKGIFRVAALWVTNSKGEILCAQRAFSKKIRPGLWGPAVSGTLEKGETYLLNIIKETKEELGIKITENDIDVGPKTNTLNEDNKHFTQWFCYETNKTREDFKFDVSEVADVQWFNKEYVIANKDIFIPSITKYINLFENYEA